MMSFGNVISFFVFMLDSEFRVLSYNEAVSELLPELFTGACVGQEYFDLCQGVNCSPLVSMATLQDLCKGKGQGQFDCSTKAGQNALTFTCHIHCLQPGGEVLFLGIPKDAYRGYYKQLVDRIPGYFFWKDKNSVFLGCNDNFAKSAGLSHNEEIVGKTDYDLPWDDAESEAYRADDQEVMCLKKAKEDIEENQTTTQGKNITLLTSKVPLYNEKKEVVGLIGAYRDITELKETQRKLEQAKLQAERADRAKTAFMRDMEHDIRTPCNGLLGLSEILLKLEEEPDKRDLLVDIHACAKDMLDYCNTILDLSRVENDALPVLEKPFDLYALMQSVMNIEIPATKHKSLGFDLLIHDNVPQVVIGDDYRLKRILINLVSNAVKFTQRGKVDIEVHFVEAQVDHRSEILRFVVRDTGIGIPEEKQNIIFESFAKVEPTSRGLYRGQGLGLYIVNRFIHELDGDVHLKSKMNQGSEFSILLPFRRPLSEKILCVE